MALPMQGMMLSERPSGSVGGGSTATTGGGGGAGAGATLAGAGSIGNYKGVMLCNRPFAGTAAAAKGGGGDGSTGAGKHVFVTGKVKSEVGFAGKNLQTEKLLRKRVKQETALTRHRRWLADLQLTKQALEEKYMQDLQRKEENRRRFAEREARMRQITRELALAGSMAGENNCVDNQHVNSNVAPRHDGGIVRKSEERGRHAWDIGLDDDRSENKNEHLKILPSQEKGERDGAESGGKDDDAESGADSTELRAVEKRRKRDGRPCRPMWAMTEAKAEAEAELEHEEELKELLEFTQSLDFGKYIRDVEVQTMIDQVKKRIAEIEGQPEVDEGYENDEDEGVEVKGGDGRRQLDEAEARLEAKIMKLTDKSLREMVGGDGSDTTGCAVGGSNNNQQEDDDVSVARTALSEGGRSVRSVHSTRSLAAVAERARVGIVASCSADGRVGASRPNDDAAVTEGPVNDIVVVTHQEDGGLRLGGKNTVSNLPYIRRNPAV